MLDVMTSSQSLNELLVRLDDQHEELSQALERGAVSEAQRLQSALLQTAKLIDDIALRTTPKARRKKH